MNEKSTQNIPTKEYKYICLYRIEDHIKGDNIDFTQLRKNILPRRKNTLCLLMKKGKFPGENKYYSYDYSQRRKKSIDQLKLVNDPDADTMIAVLTERERTPGTIEMIRVSEAEKHHDTIEKFVNTYGYPHTYSSRMRRGAWLGSVGGGICGVVLAFIAGYFPCMAVFGFLCLLPHIVAAIE